MSHACSQGNVYDAPRCNGIDILNRISSIKQKEEGKLYWKVSNDKRLIHLKQESMTQEEQNIEFSHHNQVKCLIYFTTHGCLDHCIPKCRKVSLQATDSPCVRLTSWFITVLSFPQLVTTTPELQVITVWGNQSRESSFNDPNWGYKWVFNHMSIQSLQF